MIKHDALKEIVYNSLEKSKDRIHFKIIEDVHENSFYSDIVINLKNQLNDRGLSMYLVDTNYNRTINYDGVGKGVGIYNHNSHKVISTKSNEFDIVVHLAGTGNIDMIENLIHFEIKKYNNLQDRNKDHNRLLSTTMFSDHISTKILGLIINPEIFDSFLKVYQETHFRKEKSDQIMKNITLIKNDNRKIFEKLMVDYNETDIWFSNIVAGYQLGVFVDIGLDGIEVTYYISGKVDEKIKIKY